MNFSEPGTSQCPVCLEPLDSELHTARCRRAENREVVEVHPPEAAVPEPGSGHREVESQFFPLVSAAHEFKTPLVVMLGYADLLRSGQLGAVNDKQRQVLGEIQEGAERLQKLIQDLLLLFELRAAKGQSPSQAEPESAEVEEHLKEIFNYWAPAARKKQIRYECHIAPGPQRVQVDSLKLEHIVSNLIENALKFTPPHGRVTVSAIPCFWERRKAQSHFLFNMERKVNVKIENAVRIDVQDSGPGIPPEHHQDIFKDFFQLPGASSRGTGLGLAIARRMVEAHGGLIWVESKPGEGSKFSLLLAQTR